LIGRRSNFWVLISICLGESGSKSTNITATSAEPRGFPFLFFSRLVLQVCPCVQPTSLNHAISHALGFLSTTPPPPSDFLFIRNHKSVPPSEWVNLGQYLSATTTPSTRDDLAISLAAEADPCALHRQELLQWLNSLLQTNITKVEQCGTG